MTPSNTPSNTMPGMVNTSKPNAKTSSTKNTDQSQNTSGFNALFGQAFEKKQSIQSNIGTQNKAGAVFGDDLRSAPQTPSTAARNQERKTKNTANNAQENHGADNLAQSLAAQQMASTNTWAQTKSQPKASDQEWQPSKAEPSKGMQTQQQQTNELDPTKLEQRNPEPSTNNVAPKASDQTNKTASANNGEDNIAQRINQITQAVLQNNDTNTGNANSGNLQTASTNIDFEFNTAPINSADTLQSTAAKPNTDNLPTLSPIISNNPDGQTPAPTTNPMVNTTPVAVQQLIAQRQALYEVNSSPETNSEITIGKVASTAAPTQELNNLGTPNPNMGLASSSPGSSSSSISTRIGTPIGQPGFAKELGHTVQWAIGKNISTVDIRINPESFGPLNMRIVQKGQDIQLIIRTQDEQSATMLQQAISGLKESLANQGLQLNQVNIQHGQSIPQNQTNGSGSSGTSGNPSFSDQSKPQGQNSQSAKQQDDSTSTNNLAAPSTNSRAGVGGVDMFA